MTLPLADISLQKQYEKTAEFGLKFIAIAKASKTPDANPVCRDGYYENPNQHAVDH